MSNIGVHPRIHERHPELDDEDVAAAMGAMLRYVQRRSGEYVAIGVDGDGRILELVYTYDPDEDFFFVFHGMTPPSRKTLQELRMER